MFLKKTSSQIMAEAAERGDVDSIIDLLKKQTVFPDGFEHREAHKCIQPALEKVARDDLRKLVETLFTSMLVFNGRRMYRAQTASNAEINNHDLHCPNYGHLPENVGRDWLPRLHGIQRSIMETSKAMASVLRMLDTQDVNSNIEDETPHSVSDRIIRLDSIKDTIEPVDAHV